jgi:hypothetical protein
MFQAFGIADRPVLNSKNAQGFFQDIVRPLPSLI